MKSAAQSRPMEEAAQWMLRLAESRTPQDEQKFWDWLAADPQNPLAYENLSATLQGMEQFAGAPEVVELRSQALTLARRSHDVMRARAFMTSRLGKAASFVFLAITLAITVVWLRLGTHSYKTDIGERRVVTLADGSQLSLDAATELHVDYSSERRRLVLAQGRAKFDVAKDPLRPFTVEAGGRLVVATGTSFSVELIDKQVRVALYEGRVEVLPREKSEGVPLQPGYELIAQGPAPAQIIPIDATRSLAWQAGDLAFVDEPLALAVDRVNRYAKQRVSVGDAAAAQVRISGVFHAGDTDAFVDGVTTLFPVRAQRANGATTLLFHDKTRE